MDTDRYKDQIISAIKEHLPDSGTSPEKNISDIASNREYTKKLLAVRKIVALRKHEKLHERTVGDIIIPIANDIGSNMSTADILSLGKDALKYNLNVNDVVCYDHFSVFYDHHPNVVTNVENIICKIQNENYIPVGKYVEVELTDISMVNIPDNIILLDGSIPKYVYKVIQIGTGYKDFKFPVKKDDLVLIGGNPSDDITVTLEGKKHMFIFAENFIAFYKEQENKNAGNKI